MIVLKRGSISHACPLSRQENQNKGWQTSHSFMTIRVTEASFRWLIKVDLTDIWSPACTPKIHPFISPGQLVSPEMVILQNSKITMIMMTAVPTNAVVNWYLVFFRRYSGHKDICFWELHTGASLRTRQITQKRFSIVKLMRRGCLYGG